jgi:hypothetical protein
VLLCLASVWYLPFLRHGLHLNPQHSLPQSLHFRGGFGLAFFGSIVAAVTSIASITNANRIFFQKSF